MKEEKEFKHKALDPYAPQAQARERSWTEDDEEWLEEWHKGIREDNPDNPAVCGGKIELKGRG